MSEKIYVTADEIQSPSCDVESQETSINWLRRDDIAVICTSDPTMVTKLKNIMKEDSSYKCFYYKNNIDKETGRPIAYQFECEKGLLTFRRKTEKKELSAEERLNVAKRLSRYSN